MYFGKISIGVGEFFYFYFGYLFFRNFKYFGLFKISRSFCKNFFMIEVHINLEELCLLVKYLLHLEKISIGCSI